MRALLLLLSPLLFGAPPRQRAAIPPAGGLEGVEARIDGARGVLDVRRGGASRSIPIPIERTRLDLAGATVDAVPIGEGRQVLHVRVADAQRKDLAFEAIVSGASDEPIFAGLTGYTRGEEGDRSGQSVLVYDRGEGESKFVIVADAREDTRICGQATTPLSARGLDPKTMQLRGATLHRLDKAAREGATKVAALAKPARAPLARVLVATGGSAEGAAALTDGKPDTFWSERRPGDGHGEFVTMRAPSEVPIHSVVVTIAPTAPKAEGAAPHTFFLATDERLFHVTVPDDAWQKPSASYEVALPEPIRTTCVAVVLDEAFARGLASPEVSLAEVAALTKFDVDGATLDDVAKELGTARAEEAAALLRRSGDDGLAAVARRWDALDAPARAFAVDVASSAGTCEGPAAELLTRALADKESEVRRRALGRLERCGKAAAPSLAAAVRSSDEPRRAAAAPLLAAVAPSQAIAPLAEMIGRGKPETRRALRGALARASVSAPRDVLLALLGKTLLAKNDPGARLDLLRSLNARLPELRPDSAAAIADVLRAQPDTATRWLVVEPLAQLARSPGATSGELTRLAELARRDPEWPVRARAIELAADIPLLHPQVVGGASDAEPRVREAALKAITAGKIASGSSVASRALASDPWTFVRVAAAEATADDEALGAALGDASPKVRGAAVSALGNLHATRQASKLLARVDDPKEDVEVRALAARALGRLCVASATDRLTKLALLSRAPVDEADERIGMAAIDALTTLHPADLAKRLAPLREKAVRLPVRRAVDLALAPHEAADTCKP